MSENELQALCERGQRELMGTQYLSAAQTLSDAEAAAWVLRDFDTLSRLYLPLQETRRQIRQRCGEGRVALHCFSLSASVQADPREWTALCPHGQMLTAGWGSVQPGLDVRKIAAERSLYLESFLGAVYPITQADPMVVVVPAEIALPSPVPRSMIELRSALPAECLILRLDEIPHDAPVGSAETFAGLMALWEQLHEPFLKAAALETDLMKKMQLYRFTLQVDPACELAHQYLADIARHLARSVTASL